MEYLRDLFVVVLMGLLTTTALRGQDTTASQSPTSNGSRPATPVYPLDGAMDAAGTVWIVDRNAPGVWKYSGDKLVLAFPGSKKLRQPLNASRCLALAPNGTLYVGDPATREVYMKTEANEMKPIMSGIIGIPMDIAVASNGTIYVADAERRVVWSKAPDAEKPTVFADANPSGLFVDGQDRLWVVSKDEAQLQRFDPAGKKEILVASRTFEYPHQVVVDKSGTAWITDGYKKALWRLAEGGKPELVFSGAPLQNPVGLFLVDDRPVLVDPHAQSVFKFKADSTPELWFKITFPQ